MRGKLSRTTRVAGAAALAAMLVVGPLGLSSARADLGEFTSTANGFALRVTVDFEGLYQKLPAAAQAEIETAWDTVVNQAPAELGLPADFPQHIDQYFSKTTVDATSGMTKAVSNLAEGTLVNLGVSAEKVGESSTKSESLTVPPSNGDLPVDVTVLEAVTGVLKASVIAGPKVDGEATLAEVNATLANLVALLPAEVQSALDSVEDAVDAAVVEAEANIDAAVATLAASVDESADELCQDTTLGPVLVSSGLCPAVQDTVATTAALSDLLNVPDLPDLTDALVAGDIANVTKLVNSTTAQRTTSGVASADAASSLEAVDVLGGFLSAELINLSSHSEANGVAGSAKTSGACAIGSVNVGDTAQITIDGEGIQISGVEAPVDLPVDTATVISTLEDEVGNILATAGIGEVGLCETTADQKAADGSSAAHSVSAFHVVIEPTIPAQLGTVDPALTTALAGLGLAPGDSLVKVTIDPTVQTAVAGTQAQAQQPPASLPRTGAGAIVTILSGLGLAVGALALRRRMR